MSRTRNDYEKTFWSRLEKFVRGTDQPEYRVEEVESDIPEGKKREEDNFMEDYLSRRQKEDVAYFIKRMDDQTERKGVLIFERTYQVLAAVLCITIMAVLLITVSYLPPFGNEDNPVNNEVTKRYIENGLQETGAVNVVTGMILNYRGFDTMGETHVLYIAASCVMMLLMVTNEKEKKEAADRDYEPKRDVILRMVARVLVPVILLFGIYVIVNGHLSPGGGFSGGAMIGAGMVLYAGAFGFKKTERFFNEHVYKVAKISALCLYVLCLSYYFYMGANGMDNHIPLGTPGSLVSGGLIFLINIFVGTEVACTMYAFYALFRKGDL